MQMQLCSKFYSVFNIIHKQTQTTSRNILDNLNQIKTISDDINASPDVKNLISFAERNFTCLSSIYQPSK